MRTTPALDALEMAISARLRAGQQVTGVVHHSDHGGRAPLSLWNTAPGCA
jgi:hypothetical protein